MKITPGPWQPALAREVYDDLGPLTPADVYRMRSMGPTSQRRYLHNVYGWHAARLARDDYRKMTSR